MLSFLILSVFSAGIGDAQARRENFMRREREMNMEQEVFEEREILNLNEEQYHKKFGEIREEYNLVALEYNEADSKRAPMHFSRFLKMFGKSPDLESFKFGYYAKSESTEPRLVFYPKGDGEPIFTEEPLSVRTFHKFFAEKIKVKLVPARRPPRMMNKEL